VKRKSIFFFINVDDLFTENGTKRIIHTMIFTIFSYSKSYYVLWLLIYSNSLTNSAQNAATHTYDWKIYFFLTALCLCFKKNCKLLQNIWKLDHFLRIQWNSFWVLIFFSLNILLFILIIQNRVLCFM